MTMITTLLMAVWMLAAPGGEEQILQMLHQQAEDWNNGDLEAFMDGYWNSPDLTFYSGGSIERGWQSTLERYQRRYQSEGREMGHLVFSDLKVEMISGEAAFVRGRWQLTLPDGSQPGGLFTLIIRRFADGWKVVHDHTSSND
ncbi:MAG TPA: nuclear transport factor 2 family protein [Acidobacteriota bacterium]|nr:nuclear transport factor 2 family protein [Acidobacteriota bacterium]